MIHTDGKPTIANTRLVPNPARLALQRAVANGHPIDWNEIAPVPPRPDNDPDYGEGDTDTEEDEKFRRKIEEQDADSAPGGYDNPAVPYDWKGMDDLA